MLGLLRTSLALIVVMQHLWLRESQIGVFAVSAFFVISGYLMTRVMQDRYGYHWRGRKAFLVNRFLRIYPQYWAAVALGVMVLVTLSAVPGHHPAMGLPGSPTEWVQNLTLAFVGWMPNEVRPKVVQVSWALTVEVFFYALICAGVSRTPRRVAIWLTASVVYVLTTYAAGLPWTSRYYPIMAGSLPFAVGAGIYFLSRHPTVVSVAKSRAGGWLYVLLMLNTALCSYSPGDAAYFSNLAISAALVLVLAAGGGVVPIPQRVDARLGDYCYPIYLIHLQAGIVTAYILHGEWMTGTDVLLVGVLMTVIGCWALLRYVDRPIQRYRNRIKLELRQLPPLPT